MSDGLPGNPNGWIDSTVSYTQLELNPLTRLIDRGTQKQRYRRGFGFFLISPCWLPTIPEPGVSLWMTVSHSAKEITQ
jgi:hypothetical protein